MITHDLANVLRELEKQPVRELEKQPEKMEMIVPESQDKDHISPHKSIIDGTHEIPFIRQVIFDEARKTTVVSWFDGDKTVVRCGEGETWDRYTGFMAAICKKMFGSTKSAKELMNALDKGYQAKLKAEAEAKEKKKRMAEEEERAKKAAKRREQAYHDRLAEMVEYYLMKRDAKEIANEIMKEQEAEENKNASEE